jgi:hypothetical protein
MIGRGTVTVVDVEVVVVGNSQSDPLSVPLAEPVAPSEPIQLVVTATGPPGRELEKVCVEPVQVNEVGVPLMVTVAELVPAAGNAE